jgi:D-alanyl-D-alanine carboxypeptidase/D-alanyl-D-alanine-endopeptidase (penicillin-binding protein 4)
VVNGSGLSTNNRLSARNLTDVLVYAAEKMEIFPEFLASLPASGWDGTLKKRFDDPGMKLLSGKVRAKTGTLSQPVSVSSLAGYVRHPVHGLVAFAIVQNGIPGRNQPSIDGLRRSQDAMLLSFMNSK